MIELIATCFLAAGSAFSTPSGWVMDSATAAGRMDPCQNGACYAVNYPNYPEAFVKLRREIKPGDRAEAPKGCTLEVVSKAKP